MPPRCGGAPLYLFDYSHSSFFSLQFLLLGPTFSSLQLLRLLHPLVRRLKDFRIVAPYLPDAHPAHPNHEFLKHPGLPGVWFRLNFGLGFRFGLGPSCSRCPWYPRNSGSPGRCPLERRRKASTRPRLSTVSDSQDQMRQAISMRQLQKGTVLWTVHSLEALSRTARTVADRSPGPPAVPPQYSGTRAPAQAAKSGPPRAPCPV